MIESGSRGAVAAVLAALSIVPAAASAQIGHGPTTAKVVPAAKIYACPAHPNMTGMLQPNGAWERNQQVFPMKVHDLQAVPLQGGGTTIICHYIGDGPAGPNWTGVFGVAYSQQLPHATCKVAGGHFVCT